MIEIIVLSLCAVFAALVILKVLIRLGLLVVKAGFFMLGLFWLVAVSDFFSTVN